VIRLGGYQPPDSVHTRAAAFFGRTLETLSAGRVRLDLVGNVLALGRRSDDLPAMVRGGELSICYGTSVWFAGAVPALQVLDLPYVVKDRPTAHGAFDGEMGAWLGARLAAATPLRLLGIWDNGFRHVSNRVRPIRHPADCRGLRIRTQPSRVHVEAFEALGAVPIPVDVKEFVEQIAGERFDGQDNPLTNTYNFGVHRFHRHLTLSGHFFGASLFVCNEAHYRSWDEATRSAVDEAARAATAFQHGLAAAEDAEVLARLDPAQNEIVRLDPVQREAFAAATRPVLEKYRQTLEPKMFEWLGAPGPTERPRSPRP